MLSKQQKLRYGEILRQQMKQKEQKKKQEDMQKRGNQQANQKNNNYNEYQKQPTIQNQPVYYEKQNTNMRQFVDPKEQLIKKMETQDYNPFGRGGGGAPNKKIPQQNLNTKNNSQPTHLYLNADQMQQMNFQNSNRNQSNRVYTQQQLRRQNQYYMQQQKNQNISPQTRNYYGDPYQKYPQQLQSYQNYPPSYNSIPQNGSYNQISQNNYQNFNSRQEYVQSQLNRDNNYGIRQQPNYLPQQQFNGGYKNPSSNQNYPPLQDSYPNNSIKNYPPQQQIRQNLSQNIPQQRTNTYENEQIQDVYKKGGRNLLKLQNQTVDEHLVKQRQKQQIQKYLKLQIQQAQRKKKQEKQRIKRQELQQQRKQLQYIEQQKRKIQQQERKKQEQKQKVINQNLKNLEKRKQLQQQAKRKIQMQNRNTQQRQRMEKQRQRQQNQQSQQQKKKQSISTFNDDRNNQSRKFRISEEDATSVIQSDTSEIQKGFNTQLSREFFKKQREKDPNKQQHDKKLQAFTQQIQKMRGQINNQGQMFQQQIIKVKMEAQRAQLEKRRAEQQIQRLKHQLKKKMDQDNEKLLRALQKTNNPQSRPPIQSYQKKPQKRLVEQEYDEIVQNQSKQYPTFSKNKPLKQKQNQQLVKKKFQIYENNEFLQRSNASGLMSLDGDSKKIPLYLENANNLTMSQVQDFAKETQYFNKRQKSPKNQKQSLNSKPFNKNYNNGYGESIVQVDEQRDYQSRKSNRNRGNNHSRSRLNQQRDELDKMIESRQKSRGGWGQMSSVNSDITKQIQDLLKKKDANINNNRPSSISNAGKQSLARQGINYEGMSLHSINGGTLNSNNTLDIDRIYNRNEARLKQLKNLGVQTINTNNDDQLNKLDQLLNKYK